MNYYVLFYYVVEDYLARRAGYREEHLRLVRQMRDHGGLLLGGALADPADQVLMVFRTANTDDIEDFVLKDPYVKNGLVTRWEIRPWTVVVGNAID